jgi:hypothetical protein
MKSKEIIKNNVLIALFMGAKKLDKTSGLQDPSTCLEMIHPLYGDELEYIGKTSLEYHKSWDFLMPVVEKIESLGVSTDIHYYCASKNQTLRMTVNPTEDNTVLFLGYSFQYDRSKYHTKKIDAVYESVIEFIKWYNKNKKNK